MTEIEELVENKEEIMEPDFVDIYYKNDNKTTFEFVIMSLKQFFGRSTEEGMIIAEKIHTFGEGCVQEKVLKEIADTKVAQVTQLARTYNYPLEVFYK